jgi:hypothetical protein
MIKRSWKGNRRSRGRDLRDERAENRIRIASLIQHGVPNLFACKVAHAAADLCRRPDLK